MKGSRKGRLEQSNGHKQFKRGGQQQGALYKDKEISDSSFVVGAAGKIQHDQVDSLHCSPRIRPSPRPIAPRTIHVLRNVATRRHSSLMASIGIKQLKRARLTMLV